jgi:sugar O-acyltransferase (sialic acid O-acetyltransferase NeuD family)
MTTEIICVGGGGHYRSVLDMLGQLPGWTVKGVLDDRKSYISALGTTEELMRYEKYPMLVTIGQTDWKARIRLFEKMVEYGIQTPIIRSPSADWRSFADAGDGSIIMNGAYIGPYAKIGKNCIINTRAIIEHDVVIGDHCHIAPGAIICGGAIIEEQCTVPAGSVVPHGAKLKKRTTWGS